MLDISLLDKNKTYVSWQIGTGIIAKLIQKLSKKESSLPANQIASHVLALVYLNDWYVFEAHAKWKGCKKVLYSEWAKSEKLEQYYASERNLNIEVLEYFANPLFNPGYSLAAIGNFAISELTDITFWNDKPGMVCSEYIAYADADFKISYSTELKCYKIKPAHWQEELIIK